MRLTVMFLLAGATALASPPRPPGKVVRIERPRAASLPHLCQLFNDQMICVGPRPALNEHIALIDTRRTTGVIGELRVDTVNETTEYSMCPGSMYKVTGTPIGLSTKLSDVGPVHGLRGLRLPPRTRVVRNATGPNGDESVAFALDLDEDGAVDVMITQYACDSSGAVTPPSSGRARICFDSYLRRGRQLERVVQDVLQQCP